MKWDSKMVVLIWSGLNFGVVLKRGSNVYKYVVLRIQKSMK